MSDKKKVLLIVNPCAGRNKSRAGTFDIVDGFSKNDYKFSIHTTTCQGDATNIVKRELGDHDMVVCCGGDGTLNETINGVMDMPRRVPIGYIPTGTTCDLASSLGLPADVKKATDIIIDGRTNDYDIGLFNNRYFSYVASFGAFTKSSYATSQKMKNRFGHAAYIVNGVTHELKEIHPIKLRLEHDGGVIEGKFYMGSVSNSISVAGIFKFPEEDVKFNDGYFEILLVRATGALSIPSLILRVIGQKYDGKDIILLRTKKCKFTFPEEDVAWTLDGEYGGDHRNVMIHVLERAVNICSPENPLFLPPVEYDEVETESDRQDKKSKKRFRRDRKSDETVASAETAEEATDADEAVTETAQEIIAEEAATDDTAEEKRAKKRFRREKKTAETAREQGDITENGDTE